MNITKEHATQLNNRIEQRLAWLTYATEIDLPAFIADVREALTIMRGLEDAEPVAICAVTPQGEVSIGWRHGYKPRHNENLYTSPQAAQTEAHHGITTPERTE